MTDVSNVKQQRAYRPVGVVKENLTGPVWIATLTLGPLNRSVPCCCSYCTADTLPGPWRAAPPAAVCCRWLLVRLSMEPAEPWRMRPMVPSSSSASSVPAVQQAVQQAYSRRLQQVVTTGGYK